MTDLGTLGGATSYANGINSSGIIVGYGETTSGDDHAFAIFAPEPEPTTTTTSTSTPASTSTSIAPTTTTPSSDTTGQSNDNNTASPATPVRTNPTYTG